MCCCARKRMSTVSVTTHDKACTIFDGIKNFIRHHCSGNRGVSRTQTFSDSRNICDGTPVLQTKPFSCSSQSGHYFVGDEQNVVFAADGFHLLVVFRQWSEPGTGSADHRLCNKGGNFIGTLLFNDFTKFTNLLFNRIIF